MQYMLEDYFDLERHIKKAKIDFNDIYSDYFGDVYLRYIKEHGKINNYHELEYDFSFNLKQISINFRGKGGVYLHNNIEIKKFHEYINKTHYQIMCESNEARVLFQLLAQFEYVKQKIKMHETNEIFTEIYKYYSKNIPLTCNLVIKTINKLDLDDIEKSLHIKSYHAGILNDVFLFGEQQLEYDNDQILKFTNKLFTLIVKPYSAREKYTCTRLPKYSVEVYSTKDQTKMVSFDSENEKGKILGEIADFIYDVYNNILDQ